MTGRGSTSMASRGDTLSTSWTPIDQVPSPSKYPPSIARGSPSSKIPPGREQLSSYGSASSSSHGNQAHLVAHRGQVGTLRACETEGAYIPALSDWTGLIDFSVHPRSRLSLAVHQDPHFRARHQLGVPSYRGSLAEPAYRGSLADQGSLAVNVEPGEAFHQKHLFETPSYQASPNNAVLQELPLYRGSRALDLPGSLHMRGRPEVRGRVVEAEDLDRRNRELGERWITAAQMEQRQRQRADAEQFRMFNPRSHILPTVHEFTHDTLVSRIPTASLLRDSSLLRPAKEVPLYQQRPRHIEAGSGADVRKKVKTRSVCRVCKVSCMFILLTNLIFVIIVGIIIFNGGLDFLTLP